LEELLLNKRETIKISEVNHHLIRVDEPAFKSPEMNFGRAHFFAPEKKFLGLYIDTYWFNLLVLFVMAIFFYCLLIGEVLSKVLNFFKAYKISIVFKRFKEYLSGIVKPLINND
jgi:ABC-type phosphate/phosphonate transport system permease subunit